MQNGEDSAIRWRLHFAVNAIPPILLFVNLPFFPGSPRFLIGNGKEDEALEILARVRGNGDEKDPAVRAEFEEIRENVTMVK